MSDVWVTDPKVGDYLAYVRTCDRIASVDGDTFVTDGFRKFRREPDGKYWKGYGLTEGFARHPLPEQLAARKRGEQVMAYIAEKAKQDIETAKAGLRTFDWTSLSDAESVRIARIVGILQRQ